MFSRFIFLFVLSLSIIAFSCGTLYAKNSYLSVATGGTGGTFFPTGGAVADLISKKCSMVKGATAEVTGASLENAKLVQNKQADLGMTSWFAIISEKMEDDVKDLRMLWWLHGSPRQWVVNKKSGIKSIKDFKGKVVVVGSPGSTTEQASRATFEALGMSFKDFKVAPLSFREGIEALKDGRVDVAAVQAGYPNSAILDIATTRDVKIISYSDEELQKIRKKYPSLPAITIPANTYPKQDYPIKTFNVPGIMVAHKDLSDDAIYCIVKNVHQNIKELEENVHQAFKFWRFSSDISSLAPLHPGAEKYYNELGL